MNNEEKIVQIRKERRCDKTKYNVYCIFKTKKSFSQYQSQLQHSQSKRPQEKGFHQKIQSVDSNNQKVSMAGQNRDHQVYKIGQLRRQFKCIKCQRIQKTLQKETTNNLCSQCQFLQNIVLKGNFQKFVLYLFDFKLKKPQQQKNNRLKLQRIESIQSCQSQIVQDKLDFTSSRTYFLHDEANISPSTTKNNQLSKSQKSKEVQRLFNKANNLISSSGSNQLGYYCNQCQVVPIVGRRFHCLKCDDFDLCQQCYFYVGHKHDVKTYDDSKNSVAKKIQQQVLKRSQKLKNTLNLLSSSIKPFQSKSKLYQTSKLKKMNPLK